MKRGGLLAVLAALLLVGCGVDKEQQSCEDGGGVWRSDVRTNIVYGVDLATGQYRPTLTTTYNNWCEVPR
jgi:major membrane immunogen (membrane-anchored lipoprotein)